MTEGADLHGEEHIRRYRETNGQVGHIWRRAAKILLLTTKGRKTGEPRTTPLIYEHAGDGYVIVASNLGAREHPGWYRNLVKEPRVELQVKGDVFSAPRAPRSATSVSGSGSSLRGNGRTTTSTRRGPIDRSRWSCSSASERRSWGRGQSAEPTPGGDGRCNCH
jgi:deazaflavin-dependent oxidoreductase (nitroreductase family)